MKLTSVLTSLIAVAASQSATESCPPVPADFSLSPPQAPGSRELPDPFLTAQGKRITKKSEWPCRRSEIAQLAQAYELGAIPGPPTSLDAAVANDNQLVVTIAVDGKKTISFTANITYPTAGKRPYPVLIHIGAATIPVPPNVATITLPVDALAQQGSSLQSSRRGLFYDLYGRQHSAGTTAAGVWAASRLVDAIERTAQRTGLDPGRVGVAGCSRNGRTALAAGGFEPRIGLTVVQEAGPGADSCWRLAGDDKPRYDICNTVQCEPYPDRGQAAAFRRFYDAPHELPFDRHAVAALVAPRALLVLQLDAPYTEPKSSFQCMGATKKVYEALGVGDRMAVSLKGGHALCQLPKEHEPLLDAYIRKFLVKEEGFSFNTDVVLLNASFTRGDIRQAYKWTAPKLE